MGEETSLAAIANLISRRDLLLGTAAAALVGACGRSKTPLAGNGVPDGGAAPLDVFRAWEEVRVAVRASPDHLAQEAARIVATKDAAGIHAFVRDRIATLPSLPRALGDGRLFGTRGALRAGAGSVGDKADLLLRLYAQAGFTAEIVEGIPRKDPDYFARAVLRPTPHPFAPPVDAAAIERWAQVLGRPSDAASFAPIDPGAAKSGALAAELTALLPPTAKATTFSFDLPLYIPVVAVTIDGQRRFANVLDPAVPFGESGTTNVPNRPYSPTPLPKVRIGLQVVTTAAPDAPSELVSAEFATEDLVGRSLVVNMMPPEDLQTLATRRLGDLHTFLPVLALTAPDLSQAEREAFTFTGAGVTLNGDIFRREGETLSVHGAALDTSPVDAAKLARVKRLEVVAEAHRFPAVRLRMAAFDADGRTVDGLAAPAFGVDETGARSFTLLANRVGAPRVAFVLDQSASLPAAFRGEAAAAFVRDLAQQVAVDRPGSLFQVAIVGSARGSWTDSPQALYDKALVPGSATSVLWRALSEAAAADPTVIVMVTDGQATDGLTATIEGALSDAPPAIFVHVGDKPAAALDEMARLTAGVVVTATDTQQASDAILGFITDRSKTSYLLRYDAPMDGPSQREVRVRLATGAAGAPEAAAQYVVPAMPAAPQRIGGLLLTITIEGQPPVTRVLAGVAEIPAEPPREIFEEVAGAFIGSTEVRFEGESPTLAAVLDDVLTERLGWEPLMRAVASGDVEAMQKAYLDRPMQTSAAALMLHAPVSSPDGPLTFPSGLRAVAHTILPRYGVGVSYRVDVLPMGWHHTALEDPRGAFEATLRATTRQAIVEDALLPGTLSALQGRALVAIAPRARIESVIPTLTPEEIRRWNQVLGRYPDGVRLVPATGAPIAFWHVDSSSGALLGVLENGAGGGVLERACDLSRTLDALELLGDLGSRAGALGGWAALWYQLEVMKAKKLLAATLIIADGTSDIDPTDWRDFFNTIVEAAKSAGWDKVLEWASEVGGHVGELMVDLWNLRERISSNIMGAQAIGNFANGGDTDSTVVRGC